MSRKLPISFIIEIVIDALFSGITIYTMLIDVIPTAKIIVLIGFLYMLIKYYALLRIANRIEFYLQDAMNTASDAVGKLKIKTQRIAELEEKLREYEK